jgi:hypothetical protein
MKLLIIDHNFQHDIESLSSVESGHEIRVWPASRLLKLASKFFPESVFSSNLGTEYSHSEFSKAREKYLTEARTALHNIYKLFQFDCIISPSDTIFYLRVWVDCAHELGIPFIVLQKETSISPYTMIEEAREIGRSLPFIGDLMLVCSDHHKQFWLNAGAEHQKVVVTGQPRFDFYAQTNKRHQRGQSIVFPQNNRKRILFFSYSLGAYSRDGFLSDTWLQLRSETEKTLIKLAKEGSCHLVIKAHPQQQNISEYSEYLSRISGNLWGDSVQLISNEVDSRHLILASDAVVGFQTTALIEAMAVKKKVVYTFWTQVAELYATDLLPFHKMDGSICVAHSAQQLKDILISQEEHPMTGDGEMQRLQFVTEQLGLVDGSSAKRCISMIENFCAKYAEQKNLKILELRGRLNELAPAYCKRQLHQQVWLVAPFWRLIELLLPVVHPVWVALRRLGGRPGSAFTHRRVRERRCAAEELAINCQIALDQINEGKFFRQKAGGPFA